MTKPQLVGLAALDVPVPLTHDQLQAAVAGLAGLAMEHNQSHQLAVAGLVPSVEEGDWREGFIVNPRL